MRIQAESHDNEPPNTLLNRAPAGLLTRLTGGFRAMYNTIFPPRDRQPRRRPTGHSSHAAAVVQVLPPRMDINEARTAQEAETEGSHIHSPDALPPWRPAQYPPEQR